MIKIEELLINGVDYSDYVSIPLQTQDTLDESLDLLYLELKGLEIESPFVPFSDVYIKVGDGKHFKEFYMQIESDTVMEITLLKKYDHNILVIEETKWLERFFVEKAVTNPIIHNYIDGAESILPKATVGESPGRHNRIISPRENGSEYTFPSAYSVYANLLGSSIEFAPGSMTILENGIEIYNTNLITQSHTITLANNATYNVKYSVTTTLVPSVTYSCEYEFVTIKRNADYQPYNLKQVMNILLETTETLRKGEIPRFKLAEIEEYKNKSDEYKKRLKQIFETKTPEFYFSKMSLFEALKTVGNYAHFIPRMRNKKIYLDLLGMDELSNLDDNYYSYTATQSTNDFCTKLDSQVNNLVNLDSDSQGSVTSPFNDGYRTLRTDNGIAVITEQNIIMPTESPIEKIVKLEIGLIPRQDSEGWSIEVGNVTPYVYEEAEYALLSSYNDDYPYSKKYALRYTIGSPNITSLNFERENAISQALETNALTNIINRKLGKIINIGDLYQIQYRITYIPNTTSRVTQSKVYKDNITKSISIAYNQSASKISSNAYGENLKGQILKLGNIEKQKMYVLPSIDLIPECGKKFDNDYYISVVKCEYYQSFIKCELGLSKDYNNKSAYVEIDSQLRFYEISEKISYDIYKIYEDYCEIGFDNETDGDSLITDDGLNRFRYSFYLGYSDKNLSMVKAKSIDKFGDDTKEVVLPVVSLGMGNSLLFEFHYVDNFSAGNIVKYDGATRLQEMVSYTDEHGEIEYLGLQYGKNTTFIANYYEAVQMGDNVPLANVITSMETYFDTKDKPIKLLKDNREAIHFTYQIHFVANNNNIVIGSGLARYSSFVTNEELNYKLVLLKNKLNKFEDEIDLTNAYHYGSINMNVDYDNKKIKMENIVAPLDSEEWKSWAVVNEIKNADDETVKSILILGENKDIKSGDIVEMPNFVFKHKIVEE